MSTLQNMVIRKLVDKVYANSKFVIRLRILDKHELYVNNVKIILGCAKI